MIVVWISRWDLDMELVVFAYLTIVPLAYCIHPYALSSQCIALLVIQYHHLNFGLYHFVSSKRGICQGGNPI